MNSQRWLVWLALVFLVGFAARGRAQSSPTRVAILVYDGVYNTEFIAPLDVFDHAAKHAAGRLKVFTVAPSSGTVTTAEGLRILPQFTFATSPAIDWLIVPSGKNYRADSENKTLVAWVRTIGRKAKVVHSNCWGAFLLGAAGLLDGKQATTFPASVDEFAELYPRVRVRHERHLVDDRGAVTSAGGVVSYDAALYLVEKYFGRDVAQKVATGLVIDWDARRRSYEDRGVSKP